MGFNQATVIKTETTKVTPDLAQKWLEKTEHNRRIRPGVVQAYKRDMINGQWRQTHQGIALTLDGKVVDGQHRLKAIIESGLSIEMPVSYYAVGITALNLPLDLHARRSVADITGLDDFVTSTLAFLIKKLALNGNNARVESRVSDFYEKNSEILDRFFSKIERNKARVISTASVRAGVLMAYLAGHEFFTEYSLLLKENLTDISNCSKTLLVLWKKLTDFEEASGEIFRYESFAMAYYGATRKNEDLKVFKAATLQKAWSEAREVLERYL